MVMFYLLLFEADCFSVRHILIDVSPKGVTIFVSNQIHAKHEYTKIFQKR